MHDTDEPPGLLAVKGSRTHRSDTHLTLGPSCTTQRYCKLTAPPEMIIPYPSLPNGSTAASFLPARDALTPAGSWAMLWINSPLRLPIDHDFDGD